MPLPDIEIRKAKKKDKAYRMSDSGSLYLWVTPAGGKLWRWAGQLVQFIGDGEIKPPAHIAPHILDWRHPLNARPVSLPQRGIACGASTRRGQCFRHLELVGEVERGDERQRSSIERRYIIL